MQNGCVCNTSLSKVDYCCILIFFRSLHHWSSVIIINPGPPQSSIRMANKFANLRAHTFRLTSPSRWFDSTWFFFVYCISRSQHRNIREISMKPVYKRRIFLRDILIAMDFKLILSSHKELPLDETLAAVKVSWQVGMVSKGEEFFSKGKNQQQNS